MSLLCVYFINRINQLSQNIFELSKKGDGTVTKVILRRPIQSYEPWFNHWDSLLIWPTDHHLFLERNFEPVRVYTQLLRVHHHAQILILRRLMSLEHHSMKLNSRLKYLINIMIHKLWTMSHSLNIRYTPDARLGCPRNGNFAIFLAHTQPHGWHFWYSLI